MKPTKPTKGKGWGMDVPCKVCQRPMDRLHEVDVATPEGYYHDECYKAITQERQQAVVEAINSLPRKFWEDEDHAVGGYISKKDLKELLNRQKAEIVKKYI